MPMLLQACKLNCNKTMRQFHCLKELAIKSRAGIQFKLFQRLYQNVKFQKFAKKVNTKISKICSAVFLRIGT